ncbi:hypothetical protein MJO28_006431 [Puccinia striiformis f. sp. tritici]|uniref:Uncharacterized protein n=1 Tax=Puccinia striiformis f. sp. tritici TaxID=168172 RepID=A0ACC0EI69_9BASI|nr:hypothetical protein MJO28_006431 [Puccinia striiformis f. sp. tritici]
MVDVMTDVFNVDSGMVNILDLPNEALENIFQCLVSAKLACNLSATPTIRMTYSRSTAAKLRPVCRKWADWFLVNHLYDSLKFRGDTAHRKINFINHLTERSASLVRPNCRYLTILQLRSPPRLYELRRRKAPDERGERTNTPFEVLEALAHEFSHSILELDLHFIDFVSLPLRTIEAIGRIQNLRVLRLALDFKPGSTTPRCLIEDGLRATRPDSQCIRSLVLATRKLKRLDLMKLHPLVLSKTVGSNLRDHQMPTITQLDIDVSLECSLDGMVSLAIALKRSLRVLSIRGGVKEDGRRIMPIFIHLRETLEGLSITTETTLTRIFDLEFPKLRVFSIQLWGRCLSNRLSQSMFLHAPLEVIALSAGQADHQRRRPFNDDPFANIPTLKRLAFFDSARSYSPPQAYLAACKAHGVKWMSFGRSEEISDIMVSKD